MQINFMNIVTLTVLELLLAFLLGVPQPDMITIPKVGFGFKDTKDQYQPSNPR